MQDVKLGQNESVVTTIKIPATPFTKSEYQLTSKRLIAETRGAFFGLIPTSKSTQTYPLKNVAGVELNTKVKLFTMFMGVLFIGAGVMGLKDFGGIALLWMLGGLLMMVAAFPGFLVISNNAGQKMRHVVWITGRGAAHEFVQTINQQIAELA
jgi:hypothetical protein